LLPHPEWSLTSLTPLFRRLRPNRKRFWYGFVIQEESRAVKVIQTKTAESTHFQKDFWNKSPWNTGRRGTAGHTDAVERQQNTNGAVGLRLRPVRLTRRGGLPYPLFSPAAVPHTAGC